MITTPLEIMASILRKKLPQGSWWEGHNTQASPIQQTGGSYRDSTFHLFKLHDKQKNVIFEATQKAANQIHTWFFMNAQPGPNCPYFTIYIEELARMCP